MARKRRYSAHRPRIRKSSYNRNKASFLGRMFLKLKSPAGMALGGLLIVGGAVLAKFMPQLDETASKVASKINPDKG